MIPVLRPNLIAGVERRARLAEARQTAGGAFFLHTGACPACIADPWGPCPERDGVRAAWEAAIAAEDAARPGAGL